MYVGSYFQCRRDERIMSTCILEACTNTGGGGLSLNIKLVIRMFKCTENLTFPNILVAYSLLTPSRVHYNSVARHTSIQKEENV